MPISMSVRSGSDAVSVAYEAASDSIRNLTMDSSGIFKKKISVYELMRIPLIYIDENGFSEDMLRYAPAGVRHLGRYDLMSKRRTNVVSALTQDKMLATALFDGTINTDVFEAWLQQGLLPVLPNGAIVVMDNASFHKSEKIQEAVEAAGCLLEYLSPHFPDLNPNWAVLRRKLGCSTDFSNPACSQFIVLRL